jgi:glycopeptide antibiotics resistance protein
VTAIAVLTLLPVESDREVRLRPFSDIGPALFEADKLLLAEVIANVLLFLPLGAALRLRGFTGRATALLGLSASVVVEGAQLLVVSGRTTSFDDLLLNTLGAVGGYALMSRWAQRRRADDPS